MKLNRILAAVMAAAMLVSAASCGKKQDYSSDGVKTSDSFIPNVSQPATKPIAAAADGPRLSINDTTAKPGDYAEVTMHVENAEGNWSMCGIHITYPNILNPMLDNPEDRTVEYTLGEASKRANASISKVWLQNMPEELTSNDLGCLFFTETFPGNGGKDGDIATFFLKIPDDAKPGTEYPVGFFYLESDCFINTDGDKAMQQYVFENWTPGKITVT